MKCSRKRKRPHRLLSKTTSVALQHATIWAALLSHPVASQYTDCLTKMVQNDANGDSVLVETDYTSFINDMSDGEIRLDMDSATRTALHQAFDVRRQEQLGVDGVNIAGASQGSREGIELFCENIYESFFPRFNVSVSQNECIQALSTETDGIIDANDFTQLASTLTGQTFANYEELGNNTRVVYSDFEGPSGAIEGTFLGSRPQLPTLFCRRIVLGTRIDDDFLSNIDNEQGSTLTPTQSSNSDSPTNFTQTPTLAPVTRSPSISNETTLAPSTRSNNVTTAPTMGNISATEVPTLLDGTLAPTRANFSITETPTLLNGTSFPTPVLDPNTDGNETIAPTTLPSLENSTFAPTSVTKTFTPTISPSEKTTPTPFGDTNATLAPTLSPGDFGLCTQSLFLCDRNRDNFMQPEEFVIFLNRQTGNKFTSDTFDTLNQIFRTLYDSLPRLEQYPSLDGSKPGPPPTPDQKANLMTICSETERAYNEYEEILKFQPTVSPTYMPTNVPGSEGGITESELKQCKLFLLVSDSNRNSQLEPSEFVAFVNRLSLNYFLGKSYTELPQMFRDVFGSASGSNGFISTIGVRPGENPPAEQEDALKRLCTDSYATVTLWELTKTDPPTSAPSSPTSSPTGGFRTEPPTPPPSISATRFVICTSSLAVADQNRNNLLDETEYVTFVNRMTRDKYAGLSFSNIDPALQENFSALIGPSGFINIAGARPGSRTDEQRGNLLRVCSETENVIENLNQPVSPPDSPTTAPTAQPTESLSDLELAQCQAFSSVSDADQSDTLDQFEYVSFVNQLTRDAFSSGNFADLDVLFQDAFLSSQSADGEINLLGIRPGEVPPLLFRSFCTLVFVALKDFNSRPRPTQSPSAGSPPISPSTLECIRVLDTVDFDRNDSVDQLEYVVLISELSDRVFPFDVPFSSLPFILQDNFGWVSTNPSSIDVAGAEDFSQLNDTTRMEQLARVCRRTDNVISSAVAGNNETNPLDHCYMSLSVSDTNGDNQLDYTEYELMVSYFLGVGPSSVGFNSFDKVFREVYEANVVGGGINIEGSRPGDDPRPVQSILLESLCNDLSRASGEARARYRLANRCFDALAYANTDTNAVLSQEEYVDFVYHFAGENRGSRTYADLPVELSANFEELQTRTPSLPSININGWRRRDLSGNLETVCNKTDEAIKFGFESSDAPTTYSPTANPQLNSTEAPSPIAGDPRLAKVYNGFILSSETNLMVSDLRNRDFEKLETAYRAFVNVTVFSVLSGRRLRGRKLLVSLLYDTVKVYRVLDGSCPDSSSATTAQCLEAYASFELVLSQDENPDTVETQYSTLTRSRIASGSLQEQLELTSPDRRFDVIGVTESSRPGQQDPSTSPSDVDTQAPARAPPGDGGSPSRNSSGDGDENNTMIFLGLIVVVVVLLAVGCFCWFRRRSNKRVAGDDVARNDKKAKEKDLSQKSQTQSQDDGEKNSMADQEYDQDYDEQDYVNAHTTQNELPGRDPAPLLAPRSEHSVEPQFDFSPGGNISNEQRYGRSSLQTIDDDEDEHEFSPTSIADSIKEDNPWGGINQTAGLLSTSNDSDSSERSDDFAGESPGAGPTFDESHSDDSDGTALETKRVDSHDMTGVYIDDDEEVTKDNNDQQDSESEKSEADTIENSYMSMTPAQKKSQLKYRREVKRLVSIVVPEEVENVDVMMEQFYGREDELIETLRNMAEQAGEDTVTDGGSESEDGDSSNSEKHAMDVEDSSYADDESYPDDYEEEYTEASASQYGEENTEASASQYEEASASQSEETSVSQYEEASASQYEEASASQYGEESASQYEESYAEESIGQYEEETVDASQYEEEEVVEPSLGQFEEEVDDDSFVIEELGEEEYYNKSFHIDNPFDNLPK